MVWLPFPQDLTGFNRSIFMYTPSQQVELLIQEGSTDAGVAGSVIKSARAILANDGSALAFGRFGPRASEPIGWGAWLGEPGDMRLVLASGMQVPDAPPGYVFGPGEAFPRTALQSGGRALITDTIYAPDGSPRGICLFARLRDGSVVTAAKAGDVVVAGVGANQTLSQVSYFLMHSAGNGVGGQFGDDGSFAFNGWIGPSTQALLFARLPDARLCDTLDFNRDGIVPDTQDVTDFIAVFGGADCPTTACGDIDFNNDAVFPDTDDIAAFLRRFGGGPCVE